MQLINQQLQSIILLEKAEFYIFFFLVNSKHHKFLQMVLNVSTSNCGLLILVVRGFL